MTFAAPHWIQEERVSFLEILEGAQLGGGNKKYGCWSFGLSKEARIQVLGPKF